MIPVNDVEVDETTKKFGNTDPTVTIQYTLYRTADAIPMGTKSVTVHFKDIANNVSSWDAGKKYVYNFTIDLEKIYFNPTITDWADGGSQSANIM